MLNGRRIALALRGLAGGFNCIEGFLFLPVQFRRQAVSRVGPLAYGIELALRSPECSAANRALDSVRGIERVLRYRHLFFSVGGFRPLFLDQRLEPVASRG